MFADEMECGDHPCDMNKNRTCRVDRIPPVTTCQGFDLLRSYRVQIEKTYVQGEKGPPERS